MTTQTAEQFATYLDSIFISEEISSVKAEQIAAMLRSQAAEKASLVQQRDELLKKAVEQAQEIERLKNANTMLDAALIASHPRGAEGRVFGLWNAARAALGET